MQGTLATPACFATDSIDGALQVHTAIVVAVWYEGCSCRLLALMRGETRRLGARDVGCLHRGKDRAGLVGGRGAAQVVPQAAGCTVVRSSDLWVSSRWRAKGQIDEHAEAPSMINQNGLNQACSFF